MTQLGLSIKTQLVRFRQQNDGVRFRKKASWFDPSSHPNLLQVQTLSPFTLCHRTVCSD